MMTRPRRTPPARRVPYLYLPPKPPLGRPLEEPPLLEPLDGDERLRLPPHPLDDPDDEPELGVHPEPLGDGRVR